MSKKIVNKIYFTSVCETCNTESEQQKMLEPENMENRKSSYEIQIWMFAIAVIVILIVCVGIYIIRNNQNFGNFVGVGLITTMFAGLIIFARSFLIDKILFKNKSKIVEPGRLVTDNGKIIGVLEGILYSTAIIFQNLTFIGFVLAVRSYVTYTSHNNKEESEFYIIGLLGSLISSMLFTGLYILALMLLFKFNILAEVQEVFSNIK